MILLDTNVISALMAPAPNTSVVRWVDSRPSGELFLSTVSIAEICYGLACLPEGQRRRGLEGRFERFVAQGFGFRVLAFEEGAARLYGDLMARRKRSGRPMSIADGQIAAIALDQRFAVATRNITDFEGSGLEVVDPFEE